MSKVMANAEAAVSLIPEGASIMVGGFGLAGIPEKLLAALCTQGTRNLTVISNTAGVDDAGVGVLIAGGQVTAMISTYVGENREFDRQWKLGQIEVDLIPQGTFAERIRAAGAGIGGFFTPTGFGTVVAEGKETRTINGRGYVLEAPLNADFALIKAFRGDTLGNLTYRKTARNFNPVMAMAARVTLAEVEELVEPGALDPETIITPGIFVQHILRGTNYEKRAERRVVRVADGAEHG